ncbi:MAG: glycine dehydrogenase (aminomethyl-transferring) [Deltaproteobacteria bacterium]|nr:MAG: glycine dehydrogenase (aminomethyl-transferring) [Deltaproteobacteria bacterium]
MSPSLPPAGAFLPRHLGPSAQDIASMLERIGEPTLDALIDAAVPASIRLNGELDLPPARTEHQALAQLATYASQNELWRSYLGYGYHDTLTPPAIQRHILENPGWYTAYTPYQAEISQGRLEALLVFQTMVCELTGMEVAGASLLDEATAAAEALSMCHRLKKGKVDAFFVDHRVHPQTLAVVRTRARPLGIEVIVGDPTTFDFSRSVCGALVQVPDTTGVIGDLPAFVERAHAADALVVVATDLLACCLMRGPGEVGADIVVGNSQRFGVPLGYGGPHAAFLATREAFKRTMPGRLIGVSRDADGNPALRMALQTREQHIRRDRATSNICTAQVLLAVCAGMFAVWHGPEGLRAIAERVHHHARRVASGARAAGFSVPGAFFDTLFIEAGEARPGILERARRKRINLRSFGQGGVVVALDETVTSADVEDLLACLGAQSSPELPLAIPTAVQRTTPMLVDPVFHQHRSETAFMRYLFRLQCRDLALNTAMIPLGSCTMKLNAVAEMMPISYPGFSRLHPFVPLAQATGYRRLFDDLERWLAEITGFAAVSLQPNAGSQGEYAGLLAIRDFHLSRHEPHRVHCLIPTSAHGTNPASAVMAGMVVVPVACDDDGNIDVADLQAKAERFRDTLAALMVTYPSTHGVFEEGIREVCAIVHERGGQVYMDGANMNAMVGLCRPGDIGADVCHLNLHKTFCIPHGGGGPGMGPIGVASHLAPFLPGHPVVPLEGLDEQGPVSAAPWGSPSILPISWAYIAMMGPQGLRRASEVAILSANYLARSLAGDFDVLYSNPAGLVAHECILDTRPFKAAGVTVDDLAKRLIDYGFHSPTMSWPVAGTLMVEPTESEPKAELDRFIDAMRRIRREIQQVEAGELPIERSPLRLAPFTASSVLGATWDHPFSREEAAMPTEHQRLHKHWPAVRRVDNVFGDKNLFCTCDAWPTEA